MMAMPYHIEYFNWRLIQLKDNWQMEFINLLSIVIDWICYPRHHCKTRLISFDWAIHRSHWLYKIWKYCPPMSQYGTQFNGNISSPPVSCSPYWQYFRLFNVSWCKLYWWWLQSFVVHHLNMPPERSLQLYLLKMNGMVNFILPH